MVFGVKRLAKNGRPIKYKPWQPLSHREGEAQQAGLVSGNQPALRWVAGQRRFEVAGSRGEAPAPNAMETNMTFSRTDPFTNQTIPFERTSFSYPCGAQARPATQTAKFFPRSYLFNGTESVGCSFSDTWNYQYLNQTGQWTSFCPITATITFKSSGECQVTYLGLPGSSQGPY